MNYLSKNGDQPLQKKWQLPFAVMWVSAAALCCIFMQRVSDASNAGKETPLIRLVIFSFLLAVILFRNRRKISLIFMRIEEKQDSAWHIVSCLMLTTAVFFFYKSWIRMASLPVISGKLGVSPSTFLWSLAIILAVLAYPALLFVLKCFIGDYLNLPYILGTKKRYLWKAYVILTSVYCLACLTVIRADYIYKDDMPRLINGTTVYDRESRFSAEYVTQLLHMDFFYADVSPLTQLLEMPVMALAAMLLFSVFFPDVKPAFMSLCSLLPFAVNPYFMECISFKYDPPQHAYAVLLSILPLLYCRGERKKYLLTAAICVMLSCTFHQVPMAFLMSVVLLLSLLNWINGQWSGKESFIFAAESAAAWAAGLALYRFGIMNTHPPRQSYMTTVMWSPREMIPGMIRNYRKFFGYVFSDYNSFWLSMIALLFVGLVVSIVRRSVRGKWKSFALSCVVLSALLLMTYSLYPLLTFTQFSPRHMYAFGLFIGLISMSAVALAGGKAVIVNAVSVVLSLAFFIFAFIYGNALSQQKEYTDYRIRQILAPLTEIISEKPDETYIVKVTGTTGYAPSIDVMPKSLNMIRRLVTTSLNEYHAGWYATGLYSYYGLPIRAPIEGTDPELMDLDLPLYSSDYYASIYWDGKYILVDLKDR